MRAGTVLPSEARIQGTMLRQLDECIVSPPSHSRDPPRVLHLRLTPEVLQQLQASISDGVSISFDAAMVSFSDPAILNGY